MIQKSHGSLNLPEKLISWTIIHVVLFKRKTIIMKNLNKFKVKVGDDSRW